MQFILIERYEGISKKAKALNDLLSTGIPKEIALEMCGFDKDIELETISVMAGSSHMMTDVEESYDDSQVEENID